MTPAAPTESPPAPRRRPWIPWALRAALLAAAAVVGYWLMFTVDWLRFYLPHGGAW